MPLLPGQMMKHYRLIECIGAGGMGVVWKALDTTLEREVAIKVLPEIFAEETERLARFEREAKLLASLNHPNIAAIYGLHQAEGQRFIAMELITGEDLSERLSRGPMPLDEALEVAVKIAAAFEAAHDCGVIHRDLKPANIRLGADGVVKVLDFGLAKAFEPDAGSGFASASLSPTVTTGGTAAGMILGTAAYMSPEQARGKVVDRRSDVWALGCVLYELLTGQPVFRGETVTDILAGVVKGEPDWEALPEETPRSIQVLIRKCLRKDTARRLRDAGDVRLEIEDAISGTSEEDAPQVDPAMAPRASWVVALPWIFVGLLGFLFAALWFGREAPAPEPTVRFSVSLPGGLLTQEISVSPDGKNLALVALTKDGSTELWLRALEDLEGRALPGTEGALFPFWSHDGRAIGFFVPGKLKRIDIASGTTQTIADAPNGRGGDWNAEGKILFAPEGRAGLSLVSASGGIATPVTQVESQSETSHRFPHFLENGVQFTYFVVDGDTPEGRVYVGSLDSSDRTLLMEGLSEAYAALGQIFHVREGTLVAQSFDERSLTLGEDSTPLAQKIGTSVPSWARAAFSVSRGGVLAYRQAWVPDENLVWFDREGKRLETLGPPGQYELASLSPDGKQVAFNRSTLAQTSSSELWLLDSRRGTLSQLSERTAFNVAWSAGGDSLFLTVDRSIVRKRLGSADPAEVVLPAAPTDAQNVPTVPGRLHASPTGEFLVFDSWSSTTDWDLWVLPLDGEQEPVRFVHALGSQTLPRVSPDGRWIAYDSNESGRREIYVQGYPDGGKWIVSSGGGQTPIWSGNGRELFYRTGDGKLNSVSIDDAESFQAGAPEVLFDLPVPGLLHFQVSADGQRFLLEIPVDGGEVPAVTVVLNGPGLS